MLSLEFLYLLNLSVTTILVLATVYRVKLEREMVRITKQNAKYKEALEFLYKALEWEDLSKEELREALKSIMEECQNA